ncbi:MAG: GNAT family N-acetyltransferase, partial [Lachnospiraceae bacterium]|nr:GNAT family N-acetyltransferase [Lachnospiraceae bacterium]
RNASKKDIPRILELLVQVNHVHAVGRPDLFTDGKRKYEEGDLKRILKDFDRPVFVCTKDDAVIGYCMTEIVRSDGSRSTTKRTDLYIDDLCVDEKMRGCGAGTALYNYAVEFASEIGCYSVTLHVWDCNPEARAFYEKMGMRPYMTAMETIIDNKKN